MDNHLALDRVGGTLEHLCQHWAERRRSEAAHSELSDGPRAMTIALSREAGVLGTGVARELGGLLGWAVYDHELLERVAQDLGVRTKLLESVDERRVGWLTETFESVLGVPHVSESAYVHGLVKTILALGAHGECIIVGRGAAFILPAHHTLRVRLIAPLDHRVVALSSRLNVSEAEANARLAVMDRERKDFVQEHLFKDPTDPHNYDLVINFSRFGVAGCAQLIALALEHRQACTKRPNDLALST